MLKLIDIRIGYNNKGLQAITLIKPFLSLLSNSWLNVFHLLFSISAAIQNEGTVRPINYTGIQVILNPDHLQGRSHRISQCKQNGLLPILLVYNGYSLYIIREDCDC